MEERFGASEPWDRVKIRVKVWLELICYDVGGLLGLRSGRLF